MKPVSLVLLGMLTISISAGSLLAQTPADNARITVATPLGMPMADPGYSTCPGPATCGLAAGGTFYYLKPFMQTNTAFVTVTNPGTPNSAENNTSFQWNFQPAFAGWLGWTWDSGLGVRARYFQFSSSSQTDAISNGTTPAPGTQTTINPPLANFLGLSTGGTAFGSPGAVLNSGVGTDNLTFSSSLTVRSIDLEATYLWKIGSFSLLGSAGGRFLELNQGYHATLTNNGGGTTAHEYQQFDYTRDFTGGGLTCALQATYQLGDSNFFLYANGRASYVVGQANERENFSLNANYFTAGLPQTQQISPSAFRTSDRAIPILELELGAEYGMNLGRSRLFFRAGAVTQSYIDAGNASSTAGNMTLFGVQGTIGLNY